MFERSLNTNNKKWMIKFNKNYIRNEYYSAGLNNSRIFKVFRSIFIAEENYVDTIR